ncbi:MAG: hypothetical protein WKF85_15430, partial [Chitinophagaceae bacterium]
QDFQVLKRFAKVFEQAYTRFLDLQKAEAQAREATIEAALEKIRSRSLAMHRSDELRDVIAIIFEKLNGLHILLGTVAIWLFNKATKDSIFWVGNNLQQPALINLPYDEELMKEDTNYKDSWQAFLSGESYINKEYSEEEKNRYFRYVFAHNDLTAIPPEVRDFLTKGQKYIACLLVEQNSSLYFDCWQGAIYSEESIKVFRRVAKVFEQAYIRFLDLQKAEAQAREAKIEVALERVRSRTMAMQKSDELPEISFLLFQQVKELGLTAIQNSIGIVNEKTAFVELSTTIHGSHLLHTLNVPIDDPYLMAKAVTAWKAKRKSLTLEFEGQELKNYNELRNSFLETKVSFPEDHWIVNICFFSKGWLSFSTDKNVSGEIIVVLKRFAAVFEQTYTRFLDLQKAEAQAREAQIELALERVRARTMAMQRSDELADAAVLLFQQVKSFGIESWGCGFNIWEKDEKVCTSYFTSNEGKLVEPFQIPLTEDPIFIRFYESRQKGEDFWMQEISGQEEEDHYKYLCSLPVLGDMLKKLPEAGIPFPTFQIDHGVNFSHGNLLFITYEPVPNAHEIFKRFGKVFEQTYTRFLDLQKAEAQAREAKIEAALERVRTAAMAMHSSEGLMQVTQILREQVALLGEKELESILIHIYNEKADEFEAWYSYRHPDDPEGNIATGRTVFNWSTTARARLDKEKYHTDESDYTIVADYALLKEWYEHLFTIIPEVVEVNAEGKILVPDVLYYNYSKILGGALLLITNSEASQHSKDLLKRASKVFNLAYARFLDLQNAEAQARDSQIQLALERIRGRSLAMHHSNELKDVVAILFQQSKMLGLEFDGGAAIHLFSEHSKDAFILVTSPITSPIQVNLPFDEEAFANNPIILDVWHAK